jgi:hypothetical protein
MSISSPDSPPNTDRSKFVSDAIELAMDISKEGVGNLSEFLSGISESVSSIAHNADDQLRKGRERRDDLTARGGRLANDAVTVALDIARSGSEEANADSAQREKNLDALSQLVSFFGSMFIDTANRTVGTTAGQPPMSRPRQITVEVAPGHTETSSAVIVNRRGSAVTEAPVRVLVANDSGLQIKCEPPNVTVLPGRRRAVKLTITAPKHPKPTTSPFIDALLLVDGVASIVVRTIVKAPERRQDRPPHRARTQDSLAPQAKDTE